jgi:ABC-type phosphate transport system substrate-binding protein
MRALVTTPLLVLALLVGGACGNDNSDRAGELTEATADPTVVGTVVVTGSSTVEPVSALVAEAVRGSN